MSNKQKQTLEDLLKVLVKQTMGEETAVTVYEVLKKGKEALFGKDSKPPANPRDFLLNLFTKRTKLNTEQCEALILLLDEHLKDDWQNIRPADTRYNSDIQYHRLLDELRNKQHTDYLEYRNLLENVLRPALAALFDLPEFQQQQLYHGIHALSDSQEHILHLLNRIILDVSVSTHINGLQPVENLIGDINADNLRSRLSQEKQKYIDRNDTDNGVSLINELLAHLIPDARHAADSTAHLIIKGQGGYGKTRLALEICRHARLHHRADTLLLTNNKLKADKDKLATLFKQTAQEHRHLILVIDYLEEFINDKDNGLAYDDLYGLVSAEGQGWVHLLVTTRFLPCENGAFDNLPLNSRQGEKLAEAYCLIADLNDDGRYKAWRTALCCQIYPDSTEEDIDNPLIATLLSYDNQKDHRQYTGSQRHRGEDGNWMLNRLTRGLNGLTQNNMADFVLLLLLFPFDENEWDTLNQNYPHWQNWLDGLERSGLAGVGAGSLYQTDIWRLGHDLLADIALNQLLLCEPAPTIQNRTLKKLVQQAAACNLGERILRSFSRAVRRAVEHQKTEERQTALLQGFTDAMLPEILHSLPSYPDYLHQLQRIPELSNTLNEKIFAVEILPELNIQFLKRLASLTAFNLAVKLAEQGDLSAYRQVVELFGQDSDSEIRLRAAQAAFNLAVKLTEQGDLSAYQQVVERFGQDSDNEIRLAAAKAAFNLANDLAEQGDLSAYRQVVERFGQDADNEICLAAAQAAFNLANDLAEQGDLSAYRQVVERFGQDADNEIRLLAAKAACNLANDLAEQGDSSAYRQVVELFGQDADNEIRLLAAKAAWNLAVKLDEQGDTSAANELMSQFDQETLDMLLAFLTEHF